MPALVVLLTAAEAKAGRRLERVEVELITSEGSVMPMEPRDAQALERARGYADLDPELAWEQWQIARRDCRPSRSNGTVASLRAPSFGGPRSWEHGGVPLARRAPSAVSLSTCPRPPPRSWSSATRCSRPR